MKAANRTVGARLRVVLEPEIALGPGKADLLEAISRNGSIAAAGRELGMSYKRAWSLIEVMNGDFGTALVATTKGGRAHGGAALTPTGEKVLALYRRMEARAAAAIRNEMKALRRLRRDMSSQK
jgi:molybdate transport system regulatory protein